MHDHGSFNRAYRLVFNEALGAVVAVPETARGRSRGGAGGSARAPAAGLALRRLAVALAVGLSAPGVWAQDAPALPQGGQVAAGQAQLTVGGSKLTVTQSSERAIINWHSFDIGSGAAVQFVQPSTSSVALNRVGGGVGSQILGTLQANGQVYLVNPAGILFGKTAQVDVGGLVASTLAIRDDDFLAGRDRFGGAGPGSVVNEGRITVQRGGRAVLLGRTVSNTGRISAPGGNVALAAGEHATLSVGANGHLQIDVDAAQVATLVANGGLIEADGGQVILTAKGADALAASVVSNTGTIQARTVANQQGRILLLGDMEHGTAQVAGTLDASAPAGGNGGFVETSAAHVQVADSARVTTLSSTGSAGKWLIDPTDFTIGTGAGSQTANGIGATTLETSLAGGNVMITTAGAGSEAGDIHVNAPVIWNANTLTLNAHRNININAVMTADGSAGLALNYGGTNGVSTATPAAGSNIRVALSDSGFTGRVDFTGTGNTLRINGNVYTIIKSLGTQDSTTGTDLQGMRGALFRRYALGANIDASDTANWNLNGTVYEGFEPIGGTSAFAGVLEGLGHTVTNLHIDRATTTYVGMIGRGANAVIRNVGIVGGSIRGRGLVGSLVGSIFRGNIASNYSTATVAGGLSIVGGLIGDIDISTVEDSYATGNVSNPGDTVGGLVGRTKNSTIRNSHASGTVQGSAYVGGLVGASDVGTTVTRSYATGNVTGTLARVGGLVGGFLSNSTVTDSYATGNVTGASYVGGLVGNTGNFAGSISTITASYAAGDVTGSGSYVGGLVGGGIGATLAQVYAMGDVTGTGFVGGLVGENSGKILNAYATGRVSGSTSVGGLVGNNVSGSTIADSFWNTETSGTTTGVAAGVATGATGKTTEQMQQLGTFSAAGWDIDDAGGTGRVWRIYDDHTTPLLRSFLTPLAVQPAYDGSGTHMSHIGGADLPAGVDASKLLGAGANGVVLSNGAAGSYTATLTGSGLYSTQQGYDIAYAPRIIATTGTAAGDIRLANGVRWDNGKLAIDATGTVFSADIAGGTGSVFDLRNGNWVQNTASLPAFAVGDFRLSGGSFLRAAGGDGSDAAPYLLTDIYGMQGMASQALLGQHFALANDVDAATTVNWNGGAGFRPIGTEAANFTGQLNGQKHVVRELFIDRPSEDYVGLFGYTAPGSGIQNLGLVGGSIRGRGVVGAIVGINGGAVSSTYATTRVVGTGLGDASAVGGLVGSNSHGTIVGSYATGDVVSGGGAAGGLVGMTIQGGGIIDSYATGTVSGGDYSAGGLVGYSFNSTLTRTYATGKVSGGSSRVGGLVGVNDAGTVVDSFWNTKTSGVATGIGGGSAGDVTGKTTEQMQQLATFSALWDIDDAGATRRVWRIYDGHTTPLLRSFLTGLTVTPDAPLPAKTYDGAIASGSAGYTAPDPTAVSGSLAYATTGVNAGSYDTAAGTLRLSGLYSHQQGYDISYGDASVNIDRKVLGIDGLAAQNKVYDGTPDATVSFTGLAGIVGSDIGIGNVVLTLGAANFADRNAGQDKAVTVTGSSLTGTAASNYAITEPTGLKADIQAKPITGDVRAADKEYDGTTAAATSGSLTGVLAIDTDVGIATSGTFGSRNVGDNIVYVAGTLTGDNAGNYKLTANTTTTANITPKAITGTITADDKAYDGTTAATTSGSLTGVVDIDSNTIGFATNGTFADKNVGHTTVNVTGTLTGNDDGNYTLLNANDTTMANITPKGVTGTIAVAEKVYDGSTAATTSGALAGVIAGDTVNIATAGSFMDKNAGQGKTVNLTSALTGTDANNYTLAANATTTANIDAAKLLVTANDAQHLANGLPYYGGNGVQYTGFIPGEDASVLGGSLLWGGTGQGAQQPGNYSLAASGLTADNYRIGYGEGLLTILAATQPTPDSTQPALVAGQLTPDVGQIDRITRQTLPRDATGDMLRSANSQVPLTVMENYLRVD